MTFVSTIEAHPTNTQDDSLTYALTVKSHYRVGAVFRYHVTLRNNLGRVVDESYADSLWGAKRWAKKAAKRDRQMRRVFRIQVKA